MRLKIIYTLCFSLLFGAALLAQDYSLKMDQGANGVHFELPENLTNSFRTVSLWVKPTVDWNVNSQEVIPILVKDKYDKNSTWGGRFQIYVDQGVVHWTIADYNDPSGYTITSDQNSWTAGRWYHLAFVLHSSQGMKMYVNGVLQSSNNSRSSLPPPPVEGADEKYVVGAWGSGSYYTLTATIDELQFWSVGLDEATIRTKMCVRSSCVNGLKAAYNFNANVANGVNDVCNAYPVYSIPSVTAQTYKLSTAPIGNQAVNIYPLDWATAHLETRLFMDSVYLTNMTAGTGEGFHIYMNTGYPSIPLGLPDSIHSYKGVIGVWSTDVNASYDIRLTMDPQTANCGSCSWLMARDVQVDTFDFRPESLDPQCGYNLIGESSEGRRWREEYFLIRDFSFSPGMDDSLAICANGQARLSPAYMSGADYLWDDGSTSPFRFIFTSGKYWVSLNYRGCVKSDTIYVSLDSVPEFSFPFTDTVICQGDTFRLECPLPGVKYEWTKGDTTRSVLIYKKGTYQLTTTYGKCQWRDQVTVQVIPELSIDLGEDTTMCLGQSVKWRFNPMVGDYLWFDGSEYSSNEVFNSPGTYWVYLQNECFYTSDTITLDWVDCDCRIHIPNAFTPNQDWVNDATGVFTGCYFEEYEFVIRDRWGNIVFDSQDPQARWDGTFNDTNCPEGLYMYRLSYRRYTGPPEPVVKMGTMMLIR